LNNKSKDYDLMTIEVTVLEFPEGTSLKESSMTFSEQGGTIGRTQNNSWVLDDPERFLSGSHCQISCEHNEYFLTDTSTNGTFVNNSGAPLGKGNRVKLNSGDVFELSDYKFQVQLLNSPNPIMQTPATPDAPVHNDIFESDDPFASPAAQPMNPPAAPISALSDPFASPVGGDLPISNELPIGMEGEETDPLAALNKSKQSFESQPLAADPFTNSYSDNASVANQAVEWPNASQQSGLIPEDWDDELLNDSADKGGSAVAEEVLLGNPEPKPVVGETPIGAQAKPMNNPVKPKSNLNASKVTSKDNTAHESSTTGGISLSESEARRRALEKENRKIKNEVTTLKKKLISLKKRTNSDSDTTLIEAMGFNSQELEVQKIAEINELSGEFIRQVVEGMMQTLASRNNVKNTFRMNMTTIQPVENNPLKFSANVDDALENMFLKDGNSYKKPIETIQESFESIADHQVAILAGIRSAFKSIVHRFEPSTLETRFEKLNKRGLIPRNEKARNWEAFNDYYEELFSDIDSSFQYLFGDEFSQAYEEQLQVLSHARKNKKPKL